MASASLPPSGCGIHPQSTNRAATGGFASGSKGNLHCHTTDSDGRFYASTGVVLAEYRVTSGTLWLTLGKPFPGCTEIAAFEFFGGANGALLRCDLGEHAEYRFQGNEKYVRCRIRTTAGTWAWTQPVWLDDLSTAAWTLNDD